MKTNALRFLSLHLLVLAGVADSARAQGYSYTSIIDSTGALKTFDFLSRSINNHGDVVFHATFDNRDGLGGGTAGEGIYVGEDGPTRGLQPAVIHASRNLSK